MRPRSGVVAALVLVVLVGGAMVLLGRNDGQLHEAHSRIDDLREENTILKDRLEKLVSSLDESTQLAEASINKLRNIHVRRKAELQGNAQLAGNGNGQHVVRQAGDAAAARSRSRVARPRTGATAAEIKAWANAINDAQFVANLDRFSLEGADFPVLVVMVHDRVAYTKALLSSLRKVRGIEKALLVISQDIYLPDMEDAFDGVDFCPFLRIVYPMGLQMNPDTFPGTDPNDCSRDLPKADARARGCNNAETPDKYGHYREAPFTVVKHHWWWKAAFVFDNTEILSKHTGYKVFLEGDHYLAPDALVALDALSRANAANGRPADVLVLGKYNDPSASQYESRGTAAILQAWDGTRDNMGMAIDRQTWEDLKACKQEFCTYDDYNWDWTLLFLSARSCFNKHTRSFVAASVEVGRVFHIGVCGMHAGRNNDNCDPEPKVFALDNVFQSSMPYMFPSSMSLSQGQMRLRGLGDNGGWGDPRDHKLCVEFAS